jgi:hypothetical protein
MSGVLFTLLKANLRAAKGKRGFWGGTLLMALLSLILTTYGAAIGFLFSQGELDAKASEWLLKGMAFSAMFSVISADFFPNYRPKQRILFPWWPVSGAKAWGLELFFETIRPLSLQWMLSIVAALVFAPIDYYLRLSLVIFALAAMMVSSDNVRMLLRYAFPQQRLMYGISALVSTGLFASVLLPQTWAFFAITCLSGAALVQSGWLYAQKAAEKPVKVARGDSASGFKLAQRFVFGTPVIRNTMIIALVMKLFVGAYLFVFVLKRAMIPTAMAAFFWVAILSPFTLFTYIGGNFWGAAQALWFRLRLAGVSTSSWLRVQMQAFILFVVFDLVLCLIVLLLLKKFDVSVFSLYAAITTSMFLLSQWFMHWFPRKVTKTFQLKGNNVHPAFTLAAGAIGIMIYLSSMYIHPALGWFFPALIAGILLADNPYSGEASRRWTHQFFQSLNKPS